MSYVGYSQPYYGSYYGQSGKVQASQDFYRVIRDADIQQGSGDSDGYVTYSELTDHERFLKDKYNNMQQQQEELYKRDGRKFTDYMDSLLRRIDAVKTLVKSFGRFAYDNRYVTGASIDWVARTDNNAYGISEYDLNPPSYNGDNNTASNTYNNPYNYDASRYPPPAYNTPPPPVPSDPVSRYPAPGDYDVRGPAEPPPKTNYTEQDFKDLLDKNLRANAGTLQYYADYYLQGRDPVLNKIKTLLVEAVYLDPASEDAKRIIEQVNRLADQRPEHKAAVRYLVGMQSNLSLQSVMDVLKSMYYNVDPESTQAYSLYHRMEGLEALRQSVALNQRADEILPDRDETSHNIRALAIMYSTLEPTSAEGKGVAQRLLDFAKSHPQLEAQTHQLLINGMLIQLNNIISTISSVQANLEPTGNQYASLHERKSLVKRAISLVSEYATAPGITLDFVMYKLRNEKLIP